jgi:hypothetical protein
MIIGIGKNNCTRSEERKGKQLHHASVTFPDTKNSPQAKIKSFSIVQRKHKTRERESERETQRSI